MDILRYIGHRFKLNISVSFVFNAKSVTHLLLMNMHINNFFEIMQNSEKNQWWTCLSNVFLQFPCVKCGAHVQCKLQNKINQSIMLGVINVIHSSRTQIVMNNWIQVPFNMYSKLMKLFHVISQVSNMKTVQLFHIHTYIM